MKHKHSLIQFAKFALVSIVFIVGTEAILKVSFDCQLSGVKYDKNLGWRYKDRYTGNIIKKLPSGDTFKTEVSFNKDGFRDTDHNISKTSDIGRIMVLGDSYTAGTSIAEDKIFTSIFSKKLNDNPDDKYKFEVMNVAVAAWSTDQQYIYLGNEGLKYKPDYVILMMAPNDIRESYGKGFFKIDKSGNLTRGNPVHLPAITRFLWYLSCRVCTFQAFQYILGTNYGSFKNISEYFPYTLNIDDAIFNDNHVFLEKEPDEVKNAKKLFIKLLSGIQLICKDNNIKLILTMIPTKMEFDGTLDNKIYDPGKVSELAANIAQRREIPYLNLYEILKENPHPLDIYISWEYHLNEKGHYFVASELYYFFNNNL